MLAGRRSPAQTGSADCCLVQPGMRRAGLSNLVSPWLLFGSTAPRRWLAISSAVGVDKDLKPMLTLERSVGASSGTDDALRNTGAFHAEVFPDLPIATTWANLWKVMTGSTRSAESPGLPSKSTTDVRPEALKVITIAANLRSLQEIEARMVAATQALEIDTVVAPPGSVKQASVGSLSSSSSSAGSLPSVSGRPTDALLLVSGSHPVRSFPGSRRFLPTSLVTLSLASRLRARGLLPHSTQLWAVANPNTESDASLAEQKVSAGATVLLTQPPFDVAAWERWLEDARRRGVSSEARIVMGLPMISSSGNLAFWLALAQCAGNSACRALVTQLQAAEAKGSDLGQAAYAQLNKDLIMLGQSPGVGGYHVMPVTARAKQATVTALAPGGLLHRVASVSSTM